MSEIRARLVIVVGREVCAKILSRETRVAVGGCSQLEAILGWRKRKETTAIAFLFFLSVIVWLWCEEEGITVAVRRSGAHAHYHEHTFTKVPFSTPSFRAWRSLCGAKARSGWALVMCFFRAGKLEPFRSLRASKASTTIWKRGKSSGDCTKKGRVGMVGIHCRRCASWPKNLFKAVGVGFWCASQTPQLKG